MATPELEPAQEYGAEGDPWRYFRMGDSFAVMDTRNPDGGIKHVKPGSEAYASIEKQMADGTLSAVGRAKPSEDVGEPGTQDTAADVVAARGAKAHPVGGEPAAIADGGMVGKVADIVGERIPIVGQVLKGVKAGKSLGTKLGDAAKEWMEPKPKIAPGTKETLMEKMASMKSDVAKKKMDEAAAAEEEKRKLHERSMEQERVLREGGDISLDIVAVPDTRRK